MQSFTLASVGSPLCWAAPLCHPCNSTFAVAALPLIQRKQILEPSGAVPVDSSILSNPSREIYHGIVALSQKGKLAFKLSSHKAQSVWQQLQEYLPVSWFTLLSLNPFQSLQLHPFQIYQNKTAMTWAAKVTPDLPVTLSNCASSSSKRNTTWTNSQWKVSVSFQSWSQQFQIPTQSRPSPMTRHMLHSNKSTTAVQNHECYLMHLRTQKTNIPKQANTVHSVLSFTVRCHVTVSYTWKLSNQTTSTPSSTVPSVPWRFLSLYLSALQCLNS